MEKVSKKGEEPDSRLTAEEMGLLTPTVQRIIEGFERLSPSKQIDLIAAIVSAVVREHSLEHSFDPVLLLLGESAEDQSKIAA